MEVLKVGALVQVTLVCSANLIISSSRNIHVSAFLTPNDETFKSYLSWTPPLHSSLFFPVRSVQGNLASAGIQKTLKTSPLLDCK